VSVLLVALGAAVGAPLRYLADRALGGRRFPLGIFAVNVVGSFILGLLVAGADSGAVPGGVATVLGTGFCGALTTYSTFGLDTVRLIADGAVRTAVLNVAASVVAGLAAALAGIAFGHTI
jgi:fluoride exporter